MHAELPLGTPVEAVHWNTKTVSGIPHVNRRVCSSKRLTSGWAESLGADALLGMAKIEQQ